MDGIHRAPILHTCSPTSIEAGTFANLLREVYESPNGQCEYDWLLIQRIPLFSLVELEHAFKNMANNRGADSSGLIVDMIKHGTEELRQCILEVFNNMLLSGSIEISWHHSVFSMLPKSGDLLNAANWRPIAILPVLYIVFSKILHFRLCPILEKHQSDDQFGFRAKRRIDDVFIILESVISKSMEFNMPLWMASLVLRKAFDRIEFTPLFEALRIQEVPESYIALLSALYSEQVGQVNGSEFFDIQRGVKQ